MPDKQPFVPKTFAVIGAGRRGLYRVRISGQRGGYDVILCDVLPELLEPAIKTGESSSKGPKT